MQDLKPTALNLWLYLSKNSHKVSYKEALSYAALKNWGIGSDKSYRTAVKELIDKGYLEQTSGNTYTFHQMPVDVETCENSESKIAAVATRKDNEIKYIDKMWEMIRDFAYEVCGYGIHKDTERLIYSIFAEEYNMPQNDVELLFKKHLFNDESVRAAYTLFWQANKEEQNMYRNILFSVMDAKLVNIRKNFERIRSEKIKAITTTNEDEYIKNRNGK